MTTALLPPLKTKSDAPSVAKRRKALLLARRGVGVRQLRAGEPDGTTVWPMASRSYSLSEPAVNLKPLLGFQIAKAGSAEGSAAPLPRSLKDVPSVLAVLNGVRAERGDSTAQQSRQHFTANRMATKPLASKQIEPTPRRNPWP
jgi:hypothetical protein